MNRKKVGDMMVKKNYIVILATITIISVLVIGLFVNSNFQTKELVNITTMGIGNIIDKYSENEEFYLTVTLDEIHVKEFRLASETYSFKTDESIYQNVNLNDEYIGISLKVTVPKSDESVKIWSNSAEVVDIGYVLNENLSESFEIISVSSGH